MDYFQKVKQMYRDNDRDKFTITDPRRQIDLVLREKNLIEKIFIEFYAQQYVELPPISKVKVLTRFALMGTREHCIPFSAFFPNYTVNTTMENYHAYIIGEQQRPKIIVSLQNDFGKFWFFVAIQTGRGGNIQIINGDNDLVSILFELGPDDDVRPDNIVSVSRIDPYLCTVCDRHIPDMQVCSGCYTNYRMRVRYCCEKCQTQDYYTRHRPICGANCARFERAEDELDTRRREWDIIYEAEDEDD
jgi:hypothetical protein